MNVSFLFLFIVGPEHELLFNNKPHTRTLRHLLAIVVPTVHIFSAWSDVEFLKMFMLQYNDILIIKKIIKLLGEIN